MFTPLLLFSKCLHHYYYFQNVYAIIIIFKMFTPLLFSKCLQHFYFPSFQNLNTTIIIFFLLKFKEYTPSVVSLCSKCFYTFFPSIIKHLPMYIFFPYLCLCKKRNSLGMRPNIGHTPKKFRSFSEIHRHHRGLNLWLRL